MKRRKLIQGIRWGAWRMPVIRLAETAGKRLFEFKKGEADWSARGEWQRSQYQGSPSQKLPTPATFRYFVLKNKWKPLYVVASHSLKHKETVSNTLEQVELCFTPGGSSTEHVGPEEAITARVESGSWSLSWAQLLHWPAGRSPCRTWHRRQGTRPPAHTRPRFPCDPSAVWAQEKKNTHFLILAQIPTLVCGCTW